MEKLLILLMLPIAGIAQKQLPGGMWINPYTISSPSLHIFFEGYYDNAYHYGTENKQPCNVMFSFRIGNHYDTTEIPEGKTSHFSFVAPFNMDTIWAKALTNCSATYDTCYWGVTLVALAIKPFTIEAKELDKGHVKVTIHVLDASGSAYIKYKLPNARNWTVFKLPEHVERNTNYSAIVNKP